MCDRLLLNVAQAAAQLGMGRSFLYELVRKGELASLKVGSARRIAVVDLERYVERLRHEQTLDEER